MTVYIDPFYLSNVTQNQVASSIVTLKQMGNFF